MTPLAKNVTERAVLLWLAVQAHDNNEITIKQAEIGAALHLGGRQIRRAITALVEAGALDKLRTNDQFGQRSANLYRVTPNGVTQEVTDDPLANRQEVTHDRANGSSVTPHRVTLEGNPRRKARVRDAPSFSSPLPPSEQRADPARDGGSDAPAPEKSAAERQAFVRAEMKRAGIIGGDDE